MWGSRCKQPVHKQTKTKQNPKTKIKTKHTKKKNPLRGVAYTFNPRTWEANVSRYLCNQGQHGLHRDFQASQAYK